MATTGSTFKVDLIFEVVEYTYQQFNRVSESGQKAAYLKMAAYLIDQTIIDSLAAANALQQHILKGVSQWDALKLMKHNVIMASRENKGFDKPSYKHFSEEDTLMYRRVLKLIDNDIAPAQLELTLTNVRNHLYRR